MQPLLKSGFKRTASDRRVKRGRRGSSIAELAPTLMLVFAIFTFPMIAFATIGMRYIFLINAAKLAASAASKATSWNQAVTTATTIATNSIASTSFTGVKLNTVTVNLWCSPPAASGLTIFQVNPPPYNPPAGSATSGFIFTCEVVINASILPLVDNGPKSWYGANIPGLTAPIVTNCRQDVMFESMQGAVNTAGS